MAQRSSTRHPRAHRLRFAGAALALVFAVAACTDSQDPGLEIEPDPGTSQTTSNTLGRCPDGGPDATTPPAGCIGSDGSVQRP